MGRNYREHIPELDGIRGWACMSVLLAHTMTAMIQAPGTVWAFIPLHTNALFLSGVDLFFVLSGFLIGGILIDQKGKPFYFRRFWIRRIARIFPVAYILLATYAAALFIRDYFGITRFDNWLFAPPLPPLWTFATFTQSFPIAWGGYGGPRWMGITWSLAIEEQFYLLFPLIVFFVSRRNLWLTVLVGIAAAPAFRDLLERLFGYWYAPYVLLPSRMDGILFGVLVALIIRNDTAIAIARYCRYALDVVALYFLWLIVTNYYVGIWPSSISSPFPPLKQSMLAAMWALVILRVFIYEHSYFNQIWLTPILTKIGLISYGLYMYHQLINGLVHGLLFNQEPTVSTLPHWFASLFVIASAIAVATLSFVYFETPIRKLGQRLSNNLTRFSPKATVEAASTRPRVSIQP